MKQKATLLKAAIALPALSIMLAVIVTLAGGEPEGHVLKWANAPASVAVETYERIAKDAGIQVVASSQVHHLTGGSITLEFSGSSEAAMKRIAQLLLERAAVIVTPLDGKRVSLTWNDTLASEQKLPIAVTWP